MNVSAEGYGRVTESSAGETERESLFRESERAWIYLSWPDDATCGATSGHGLLDRRFASRQARLEALQGLREFRDRRVARLFVLLETAHDDRVDV